MICKHCLKETPDHEALIDILPLEKILDAKAQAEEQQKQIILNHTIMSLWGVPVTLVMDFDPRLPADMHSSVKGFYYSHKG